MCGQSWGPLCQPLNDDSVEQVGFFQGLVLISQLFIGEGGHEDETGGSHRWPSIYYEEPDVADPVQRDQTHRVTLLLHSLDKGLLCPECAALRLYCSSHHRPHQAVLIHPAPV